MRKLLLLVIWIILIPILLVGCQTNDMNQTANEAISKVSISNSQGFDKFNTDFLVVYEDAESLERFQYILASAVKLEGSVDISAPEYDLEVIYEKGNKQEYHLWVGEDDERSILMKVEDTHTVYSTSIEATNDLIELSQQFSKLKDK